MTLALQQRNGELLLPVKVVPGASRSRILGLLGDALKLQVTAPPEQGKANAAVLQLLQQVLGLPATAIRLHNGQRSMRKQIAITGLDAGELQRRLGC